MISSLGPFRVKYADLVGQTEGDLFGRRDFRIEFPNILSQAKRPLLTRLIDLLRIASSVYTIDRLIPRKQRTSSHGWSRRIGCNIEVRDIEFWMASSVHHILVDAIEFVSGDHWHISFSEDRSPAPYPALQLFSREFEHSPAPIVSLYSGGLDSVAGMACRLAEQVDREFHPVVIRHRSDIFDRSDKQLAAISKKLKTRCEPIQVRMSMTTPRRLSGSEEKSQRARSFLFVSVGGAIAVAIGATAIELYESGLGSINVPLLAGMEGSQATRSAHPSFLKKMSSLLSAISDATMSVNLPFANRTKSQTVATLRELGLGDVALSAVSCVHFPIRVKLGDKWTSCGVCPACIFRRVAMNAAGIDEPERTYQHDLLSSKSCSIPKEKLRCLMAYLVQIDGFSSLDQNKLPIVAQRHLRMTGLIASGDDGSEYFDLFRRYRGEWRGFLETARRNGCSWANLIDLPCTAA